MISHIHLSRLGFTIVELLVVIVVIAILATISVSAYTSIQQRAANVSRVSELVAWKKSFMIYRALAGGWPPSMVVDDEYCLGVGYPIGAGGVSRCHNYMSSGSTGSPDYAVLESDNAILMTQLRQYTDLPGTGDRTPINGIVGPYVRLKSAGDGMYVRLTMTQSGTVCPNETEVYWTDPDGSRSTCIIEIK